MKLLPVGPWVGHYDLALVVVDPLEVLPHARPSYRSTGNYRARGTRRSQPTLDALTASVLFRSPGDAACLHLWPLGAWAAVAHFVVSIERSLLSAILSIHVLVAFAFFGFRGARAVPSHITTLLSTSFIRYKWEDELISNRRSAFRESVAKR